MKKVTIITLMALTLCLFITTKANAAISYGTYYNYMVVVEDNSEKEWELPSTGKAKKKYMEKKKVWYNGKRKSVYMPKFEAGQRVKIKTKGNRLIWVKAI